MKTIKYFSILLSLLIALIACSDDLEKVTFYPENANAGELLGINGPYVLEAVKQAEVMETFTWGKMDFGFQAAITYTLEADLAGENFANVQEVAATPNLSIQVTQGAMNKAMMTLQKAYKFQDLTEQNVEFRVKGSISNHSTPVYTNVVAAKITSYPEDIFPELRMVGDYCGWSHGSAQKIFSYKDDGVYSAWVKLDGKGINGFKVSGGVTDWNNDLGNWGLEDGVPVAEEAASIALWNDGGSKDIKAYKNTYYRFTFDKATGVFTNNKSMNSFGIVGNATPNEWDGPDIVMDFDTEKQVFTAIVTLVAGEIKFRADNDFAHNYGGANGALSEGGDNIAVEAGTYKITVNINNPDDLKYTIVGAVALDPSRITTQVLEAVGDFELAKSATRVFSWSEVDFQDQEPTAVTYNLEVDLKGANFANPYLLGTTKEATLSISGDKLLEALKALDATTDLGIEKEIEVRVVATVSGLSNVLVSNVESSKAKVVEDPIYPTSLFMTGDEFGAWFGDLDNVVEMIPVHGTEGVFWTIKYFTADKGFKWAPQKGWGNDFNAKGQNVGFVVDGGNAKVEQSGLYMVYIDLANDIIKFEAPLVYGIGNAFGDWDENTHAFAIEGKNMTINTTATNELRMYATSSIAQGIEWWKMEFIVRDGVIEYRGNGDDQNPRVSVTAGQKITLNLTANTGSIQ